jgi:23S rRNA pseudouridine1911/1915/1917 synthase
MSDDPHPDPSHRLTVSAERAGERLDRFLALALADDPKGLSRSRVKNLILDGAVTRDGAIIRDPAEAVRAGVSYRLALPAAIPAQPQGEVIPLPILYEDADLIVLDKPAGLVVHPAPGNADGTLVNALIAHCGDSLTGIGGEQRPGIVHRLDKDTSGVMVAAKTQFAHAALSAAFAARDLDREYLALCWGVPNPPRGDIEAAIGRDPRDRKRMAVVARGGKSALTHYELRENFGLAAAFLACRLATGRTHQIRVHLAHRGHPLIGDPVYLRRRPAASSQLPLALQHMALDFPRQALHAARLGFRHPRTGETLDFMTPLPADFENLVLQMRNSR